MQPVWMGMMTETTGRPMPFWVAPELVVTKGWIGVQDDTLAVKYSRYEPANGEIYDKVDLVYRMYEIEDIGLVVLDMDHWHIFLSREDFEARRALAQPCEPKDRITSMRLRSHPTISSRPFPDLSDFHETEAEKRRRQADRIANRARFVAMKPTPEQLAEWDAKNPEE